MAVAASVKTVITVKGNDQASRQIKKSTTAMGRLSSSMTAATAKSQALGASLRNMATGNISGALSSVGGLLGGPGGAGGIAAAAGAATAATVALGVAVGVAAFKFTEWSSEIERSRAALDNTFGGQGVEKAIGFARQIGGVGVESVQKLATTLKASGINATVTAEQMQELANRATQMGKSGDEALTAFADAIRGGETGALKMTGVIINGELAIKNYAKAHGFNAEAMSAEQRSAAVLEAVLDNLSTKAGATSAIYARQDDVLARLSVAWSDLKFKVSEYLNGPAAGLLENITETVEFFAKFGRVIGAVTSFIVHSATVAWQLWGTAVAGVASLIAKIVQGKGLLTLADHMDDVVASMKKVAIDDTASAFTKMTDAINDSGTATKKTVKQIQFIGSAFASLEGFSAQFSQGIAKRAKLEADLARKRAERARRAAKAAARRRAAAAADAKFFADLSALRAKDDADTLERQRSEIAAMTKRKTDLQALAGLENQLAQVKAANNPAELARLQNLQTEAELQQKIATIKQNLSLSDAEQQRTIDAVRGIAHAKQMSNINAARKAQEDANRATVQGYLATGNAAVSALAQVGVAERAIAGVKAIMAGAEAFLAFARYDFAAGFAATAAAIQFGKVALTSPEVPSGPQQAAPALTSPGITQPSSGTGGGAASYNITINGVYATAAETGAAIKQALGAAAATGMQGT